MNNTPTKCKRCNGKGTIPVYDESGGWLPWPKCADCGGTGKQQETK